VEGSGSGEPFCVEEFYDRVAQKEGVNRDWAVRHARAVATAVATAVQTAVRGGEVDDVRSQLSAGYGELFVHTGASV